MAPTSKRHCCSAGASVLSVPDEPRLERALFGGAGSADVHACRSRRPAVVTSTLTRLWPVSGRAGLEAGELAVVVVLVVLAASQPAPAVSRPVLAMSRPAMKRTSFD